MFWLKCFGAFNSLASESFIDSFWHAFTLSTPLQDSEFPVGRSSAVAGCAGMFSAAFCWLVIGYLHLKAYLFLCAWARDTRKSEI